MINLKPLFNNPILKNLSVLVTGTIIAQVIVVAFQIFLRHIYSPADFGAFAVYLSIVGILATVSSLRYEQVIVLPANEHKAYSLLWLAFIVAFIVCFFIAIYFVFFSSAFCRFIDFPQKYQHWLFYVPLSVFLLSVYQALNYYLIRLKLFRQSASNKVERRIAEGLVQVTAGKLGFTGGLVWGDIAGQTINAVAAGIKIKKSLINYKFNFKLIKNVAGEYKHFPLKNGLASFLNALSLLMPVLFINRLFSEHVTGQFDLARLVLIMPLSLVTASMTQVILQRFTELRNNKQSVKQQAVKIFFGLAALAFVFALVVYFLAPCIIALVFGNQWAESGIYTRILVWAFALKFVVSPFNIVFTVFERIGLFSVWQTAYFVVIFCLIFVQYKSPTQFMYFYMSFELVSSFVAGIMSIFVIKKYENSLIQNNL